MADGAKTSKNISLS